MHRIVHGNVEIGDEVRASRLASTTMAATSRAITPRPTVSRIRWPSLENLLGLAGEGKSATVSASTCTCLETRLRSGPRCSWKRLHVSKDGSQIRIVHRANVEPRHRRARHETLGILEPLVFAHLADRQSEIRRIRRTPRTAISELIAFEPVRLRGLSSGLGVARGVMTIITSTGYGDIPSAFDQLRIWLRLLCMRCLMTLRWRCRLQNY